MNKYSTLLIITFLSVFFWGCQIANTKASLYKKYNQYPNTILLSCNYCSCVTEYLSSNEFEKLKSKYNIHIYADSLCFGTESSVIYSHLSQSNIDSIFIDNYNAILVKSIENQVFFKLLKTEDRVRFSKIITRFYD